MTGKTRVLSSVSGVDTVENLSTHGAYNRGVPTALWFAANASDGFLAAVSERGVAPPGASSPTAFLARGFAESLGFSTLPIVRATQVHGTTVSVVETHPDRGEVHDVG